MLYTVTLLVYLHHVRTYVKYMCVLSLYSHRVHRVGLCPAVTPVPYGDLSGVYALQSVDLT